MKFAYHLLVTVGFAVLLATGIPEMAWGQGNMTGVRAMGMGEAVTAGATGSGALFHNPAGISALMMYSVEASYVYDQSTGLSTLHASIIDGKSNPSLGGGVGYTYSISSSEATLPSFSGHDVYGALSMPVVPGWLIAGIAIHYLDYSQYDESVADGITMDAGLMVSLGDYIAFGTAVRNILDVENSGQGIEAGFGLNFHIRNLQISTDTIIDFSDGDDIGTDFRAGLEYMAIQRLPLRIGYQYDDGSSHNLLSAGAGWRHELLGIDLLFRQDLDEADSRMLGLAINVYL